jgi:hypothetical protein
MKVKVNKGTIGVPVFKAALFGDAGEIEGIEAQKVYCGYGVTEKDAVADFIFENDPHVLKMIFRENIPPKKEPKKIEVKKVETKKNKLQGKHPKP